MTEHEDVVVHFSHSPTQGLRSQHPTTVGLPTYNFRKCDMNSIPRRTLFQNYAFSELPRHKLHSQRGSSAPRATHAQVAA